MSSPKQTHGASLEEQLEACRRYAAAKGWRVVVEYVEAGRSAYAEDLRRRPQFQAMRAAALGREFDIVLVYDLSRFGRRRKAFAVGEELEQIGVRLVSATEQFDISTIEGFVTYSILAMQAELSSRLLSKRMQSVRAHEAAQGAMMLKAPRGYTRDEAGAIVPSPDAPFVAELFTRAQRGETTGDLLSWAASIGRPLAHSTFHDMIRNPAYAGRQIHRGTISPAAWPAIVDPEVFDAVQAMRAARRPALSVRAVVRTRRDALLAGLLFCGNCGAKLVYEHRDDGHSYYRCGCRKNGGHCQEGAIQAVGVEGAVAALVGRLVLPDKVRKQARVIAATPEPCAALPPDPAAVRERLRRLARAYADGAYTDAEYEAQRAALEALMTPMAAPASVVNIERALALLDNLPALWAGATGAERRAILAQIVSHIYVRRQTLRARNAILALRPTRLAAPALAALWSVPEFTSWGWDAYRPTLLSAA